MNYLNGDTQQVLDEVSQRAGFALGLLEWAVLGRIPRQLVWMAQQQRLINIYFNISAINLNEKEVKYK